MNLFTLTFYVLYGLCTFYVYVFYVGGWGDDKSNKIYTTPFLKQLHVALYFSLTELRSSTISQIFLIRRLQSNARIRFKCVTSLSYEDLEVWRHDVHWTLDECSDTSRFTTLSIRGHVSPLHVLFPVQVTHCSTKTILSHGYPRRAVTTLPTR